MVSYSEQEFIQNVAKRVKEKTGLEEIFIMWYNVFAAESYMSDGIVDCDRVKQYMEKFLIQQDNNSNNTNKYTKYVEYTMRSVLEIFEKEGLLEYVVSNTGEKYPKLIGYNYLNDTDFYLAYRKKGEEKWHGRISRNKYIQNAIEYQENGYEFREKNIISKLFN